MCLCSDTIRYDLYALVLLMCDVTGNSRNRILCCNLSRPADSQLSVYEVFVCITKKSSLPFSFLYTFTTTTHFYYYQLVLSSPRYVPRLYIYSDQKSVKIMICNFVASQITYFVFVTASAFNGRLEDLTFFSRVIKTQKCVCSGIFISSTTFLEC